MELSITDYTAIFVSVYPWETIVNPHTTTQSHIPHLKYRPNLFQAKNIIFDIRISAVYPSKDCKLCHGKSSQLQPWFAPQEPQFTDLSGEYNLTTTQIEKKAKAKHLHKDFLCLILCTIFPNHKPRYSHFRNFLSEVPRITKTFGNQIARTKARQLTFPASDFKCFCNNFIWTPVSTKPTKRWLLWI